MPLKFGLIEKEPASSWKVGALELWAGNGSIPTAPSSAKALGSGFSYQALAKASLAGAGWLAAACSQALGDPSVLAMPPLMLGSWIALHSGALSALETARLMGWRSEKPEERAKHPPLRAFGALARWHAVKGLALGARAGISLSLGVGQMALGRANKFNLSRKLMRREMAAEARVDEWEHREALRLALSAPPAAREAMLWRLALPHTPSGDSMGWKEVEFACALLAATPIDTLNTEFGSLRAPSTFRVALLDRVGPAPITHEGSKERIESALDQSLCALQAQQMRSAMPERAPAKSPRRAQAL